MGEHKLEYKHPTWMFISRLLSGLAIALGIIFWLPDDHNIFVGMFIVASVVNFTQDLHVALIERPAAKAWLKDELDKEHKR